MIKVGRYTSALLLVSIGILLLIDQSIHTNYVGLVLEWWPVLFILLGIEYLLFSIWNGGHKEHQLRLDLGGLIFTVVIAVIVVGVTQTATLGTKLFDHFHMSMPPFSLTDDSGTKFVQETTVIPVTDGTEKIYLDNLHGNIAIRSGPVENIEIQTTVYVASTIDKDKAREIADASKIEFSGDKTLRIAAKGQKYTFFIWKQSPVMHLVVTLPDPLLADVELKSSNGEIEALNLAVEQRFQAISTNGKIQVTDVRGEVLAQSTNGSVAMKDIDGKATAKSTNGSIKVGNVSQDLILATTNGSLVAENIEGDINARTTNGAVKIFGAGGNVEADSTNGSIDVDSRLVNGDWTLKSNNGGIRIRLPQEGNYELSGTTHGSIETDLPLTISRHTIHGNIGKGTHQIKLDTNGSIRVNNRQ